MKKILYGISALLLIIGFNGCTAKVFDVNLKYKASTTNNKIIVKDGRLDKQIYMTSISWSTSTNTYFLKANPNIEEVIKNTVSINLNHKEKLPQIKEIIIEELDLKNKVGFGQEDELYCKIESKIIFLTKAEKELSYIVKTFSINKKNMSPFVYTSAKVILDQCLYQHSIELVNKILSSEQ